MKIFTYVLSVLIIFCNSLHTEILDTLHGRAGDVSALEIDIPLDDVTPGPVDISGTFKLSNPTVFFPDSVAVGENARQFLLSNKLERMNDSVWNFQITLQGYHENSVKMLLHGEILAGSDTVCDIAFTGIKINEEPLEDFFVKVIIDGLAFIHPYIRFPRIIDIYPHPVRFGEETTMTYYFDRDSEVKLYIVDITGKHEEIADLGFQIKGFHKYTFVTGHDDSSGMYFLYLKTNSGDVFKRFLIVK